MEVPDTNKIAADTGKLVLMSIGEYGRPWRSLGAAPGILPRLATRSRGVAAWDPAHPTQTAAAAAPEHLNILTSFGLHGLC